MTLSELLALGGRPLFTFYKFCQAEHVTNNFEFLMLARELNPALGPTTWPLFPKNVPLADRPVYLYRRCVAGEDRNLGRLEGLIESGRVTFDGTAFTGLEANGMNLNASQKADLITSYKKSQLSNSIGVQIKGTKFGRADTQVNLSERLQVPLDEKYAANQLTALSFNDAYADTLANMRQDTWPRFLKTREGAVIDSTPAPAAAAAVPAVVAVVAPASSPAWNAMQNLASASASEPADPVNHLRLPPPPNAVGAAPASAAPQYLADKRGPHLRAQAPALPPLPAGVLRAVKRGPHMIHRAPGAPGALPIRPGPAPAPALCLMPLPPTPNR